MEHPVLSFRCAACKTQLSATAEYAQELVLTCPNCKAQNEVHLLPAFFQEQELQRAEALQAEEESSCFFHPQSRAEQVCENCGRFLCPVCAIAMDHKTLCPQCLESAVHGKKTVRFQQDFPLYDSMALSLSLFALVVFWLAPIFVPVAGYFIFRHWRTPHGILPRRRWRFVLAGIFSLLSIALFLLVLFALIMDF